MLVETSSAVCRAGCEYMYCGSRRQRRLHVEWMVGWPCSVLNLLRPLTCRCGSDYLTCLLLQNSGRGLGGSVVTCIRSCLYNT